MFALNLSTVWTTFIHTLRLDGALDTWMYNLVVKTMHRRSAAYRV